MRLLLLVVVVVAVYRQYGTILGRNAGVALLVGLLGLKLLELRNARDYLLSLFLFYLVLLGAYLQEQAPWLGVWTLVTITVSLVAMLQLNQPQGLALRERLRLAGTLLAKALPLMLVVYLLFPRIRARSGACRWTPTARLPGCRDHAPGEHQQQVNRRRRRFA